MRLAAQHPLKSTRQRFFRIRANDALPLTITHERIYILPSARGWMFVASLLIMLVASINYSLSLGYALCFLLTGLFASALLATYRNLAGITVSSIHADNGTAGETLAWQIGLQSSATVATSNRRPVRSRSGITLRTDDIATPFDIPAGEHSSVSHLVPAGTRGWQALGRITLSSDYPLGLWYTWCYLHVPEHALVLPSPEIEGPPLPHSHTGDSRSTENLTARESRTTNSGEFAGLRAYRSGDSLNNIAWKAAARGQGLQSMEFSESTTASTLALHWDDTGSAGDTETRLSRLARWVNLANSADLVWSLELPEASLPLANGKQHTALSQRALALHGMPEQPDTGAKR